MFSLLSALQGFFLFCLFIIQPWFYPVVKYCFNAICFTHSIFVNSVIVSSNISCSDFILCMFSICQLKFNICLRCDMAFIDPMHRNKPNITYLLMNWINNYYFQRITFDYQIYICLGKLERLPCILKYIYYIWNPYGVSRRRKINCALKQTTTDKHT